MDAIGAKFQSGRAEVAANVSEDIRKRDADAGVDVNVANGPESVDTNSRDRPGEAQLVSPAAAKFVGWPDEDVKNFVGGEIRHFKLKKEDEKIKVSVDGNGFEITGASGSQDRVMKENEGKRGNGETRREFLMRKWQDLLRENPRTQQDKDQVKVGWIGVFFAEDQRDEKTTGIQHAKVKSVTSSDVTVEPRGHPIEGVLVYMHW